MPFTHTPHLPIILWCLVIFPLTLWDAAYIFLRPHSFPGGKYHEPFFLPMVDWANADHLYGEQAWTEKEGFTAAQGVLNIVEATLYMVYVNILWQAGGLHLSLNERRIHGDAAAKAVLVGLTAGTVTATKTALYFMREIFSGFKYTCHNERFPLFTLWGFMNFLYLFASGYMIGAFGNDVLEGLTLNERTTRKEKT